MARGEGVLGLNYKLAVLVSLDVELLVQRLINLLNELRLCGVVLAIRPILRRGFTLASGATTSTTLARLLKLLRAISYIVEERVGAEINVLIKSFLVSFINRLQHVLVGVGVEMFACSSATAWLLILVCSAPVVGFVVVTTVALIVVPGSITATILVE